MNSVTGGLWRQCLVAEGSGWDGYIYLPSLLDRANALLTMGSGYVREWSTFMSSTTPLRCLKICQGTLFGGVMPQLWTFSALPHEQPLQTESSPLLLSINMFVARVNCQNSNCTRPWPKLHNRNYPVLYYLLRWLINFPSSFTFRSLINE